MRPAILIVVAGTIVLLACSSNGNKQPATTAATQPAPVLTAAAASTIVPGTAAAVPAIRVRTTQPATRPPTATPTPTHPDETAAAKALLLTVDDFPAGWTEEPRSDSGSSKAFEKCDPGRPAGETGKADSGDFSNGSQSNVSESAALFDSSRQAAAALDRIPALGDCLVQTVNSGGLDDDQASYSGATFSPVAFPQLGDATKAYRFKLHAKVKGQTGPGSEVDAYLDIVYVISGRAGFSLVGFNVLTAYNPVQFQQITRVALAKLQKNTPPR